MPASQPVPTEDQEQAWFVQWLTLKGLKFFRVPNETYTKSFKQRAKNKRLGVVPGVPDIFVIVDGQFLAIEMKRTKGSSTSPEQKDWIEALNNAGVPANVCKGFEDARAFVEAWEPHSTLRVGDRATLEGFGPHLDGKEATITEIIS